MAAPEPQRAPANGGVRFAEGIVASVVSGAALSCYGVVDLARPPEVGIVDRGRSLLLNPRRWRAFRRPLGSGAVSVQLDVVLASGLPAATVARNLVATVSYQVERALGVPVGRVEVVVAGLRLGTDGLWSAR